MLVVKGVKVHQDTHRVLKLLKESGRRKSMDEVVRALIKGATGKSVEQYGAPRGTVRLTSFTDVGTQK